MKRLSLLIALLAVGVLAQDRLPSMPGTAAGREARQKLAGAISLARLDGNWVDGKTFAYREGSEWVILDCATGQTKKQAESPAFPPPSADRRRQPSRGRQFTEAIAPDGTTKSVYRDGNVFLVKDGKETPVTTEGSLAKRIKFGSASWVYGEELDQREAMGFSPDGKKLWFYRFDESKVKDYFLALGQGAAQNNLYVEAYPKPGQPNPEVGLLVFDLETGKTANVSVQPGAFDDGAGHYVYGIRWRPDGKRLLFYRTDRKQKALEFCAADPVSGAVQVLDREENQAAWVENAWPTTYLDEVRDIARAPDLKNKAIWISERDGWGNLYLMDLEKGGVVQLTKNQFDVRQVVQVDLARRRIFYTANSGDASGMRQLHVVGLDGKGGRRITDPAFNNSANLAPGGEWAVVTSQRADTPPRISLVETATGKAKELRTSDISKLKDTPYRLAERFGFTSADGKTPLRGVIHFPPNFDPSRKYPVLVSVYGGPLGPTSDGWSEGFRQPNNAADYGFLIVELENRGTGGRGRAFKTALYQNMGIIEIDDQAAGLREVLKRPYADPQRTGIYGTSYGGYATLMALGRYPELFRAGASSSCVSHWKNYDTTYTERYMGLLPESNAAYEKSSFAAYARDFKGWLLIYYGTADDNTHPTNSYQVIQALQRAGKSFEVQVGVDAGHSGVNFARMMEFFIERLVMTPPRF